MGRQVLITYGSQSRLRCPSCKIIIGGGDEAECPRCKKVYTRPKRGARSDRRRND